jgi:uncharacterized protein YjbI with pentapeptide repeats
VHIGEPAAGDAGGEMAKPWISRAAIITTVVAVVAALAFVWAIWWLWVLLSPPESDIRTTIAISIVALVLLAAIWWLWWRLPQRQVARVADQIPDPKDRADTEDNFRKTVGQALGGAAVLIGAVAAYLQFTQQQRASDQQSLRQQQAAHDLLISNQVSKGFEQLANDKSLTMRLGGIYGLEGVMNTSPDYHQPVLEALCAFVRDSTVGKTVGDHPATDIQAALTVIGRRKPGQGGAYLAQAKIPGAYLRDAELQGADLRGADLNGANLNGANLNGANLNGANLDHANLSGAVYLTQEQLELACGRPAELPPGLALDKPC